MDSRSYSLSLYSGYSQVETTDLITGITDIIIYRVAENALYINGIKTSENVVKTSLNPYSVNGPFTYSFDVNPNSIGLIAACAVGVYAIIAGIAAAGVSTSVFTSAISKAADSYGIAGLASAIFPGWSINGWFQFHQEHNGNQSRNLNRYLYIRAGYNAGYTRLNYGNGGWFYNTRPY